ncbi:MAG: undecaprenyldiphospho-muramoylpentapeptide beta-N-acetylglucosaminyltransferase [Parvularculaceae bacterium]|nr:undecaprenyldiphospho-muramoylpentapeptide beta-N-acetylglucosaminyltransferase [Parvularculaceae bacterium]
MSDGPLIALAAGGTGGHMFPAEALAQELKRRERRVLLVTDARGDRYTANFPTDEKFLITAASPSVGGPIAKAAAAFSLAGALMKVRSEFRRLRPAAVVGFGGYPSFPAIRAAAMLKIPHGVHEQNGVLGRANRMSMGSAAFLAHGFAVLERRPENSRARIVEVGNPVRDAVRVAMATRFAAPRDGDDLRLLVFGGSQGAALFSTVVPAAIAALPDALRRRLVVAQQARETELDAVKSAYAQAGVTAELAPFFKDLPARIAAAHLVIARAGASTVTELSAIGRPSILVPLAIAMDDHQTGNARALSDAGAALCIAEKDFTAQTLSAALLQTLGAPGKLEAMAAAAKDRVKSDAASALADLVDRMIGDTRKAAA